MTEKLEGTIVLDGMVEGRLPDDPDVEAKLHQWVDFAKSHGLPFTLDVSGNAFSLLPDNKPLPTAPIGDPAEETVRQALDQLLDAFPDGSYQNVFSTLRSAEYRAGEEVQSVYLINPLGEVDVQTRAVKAKTVAPVPPLTTKEKVKMGLIGVLIAAITIGIASFFVDFRNIAGEIADTVTPLDPQAVQVDAKTLSPYVALRQEIGKRSTSQGSYLVLNVYGTDAYPADDAAMQAAYDAGTLKQRLAIEALARGYIRVEVFGGNDKERKFLGQYEVRVDRLGPNRDATVEVPIPSKIRLGKIVLTY